MLVARRFAFFDFNLKAQGLILLRLGCAGFAHEANEKWRKRSSLSTRSPISLTQIIQDDSGGPPGVEEDENHATIILLAAGDSGLLSTIREQKHLLHHRSHCRYRHRPQSAPRVLAQS